MLEVLYMFITITLQLFIDVKVNYCKYSSIIGLFELNRGKLFF